MKVFYIKITKSLSDNKTSSYTHVILSDSDAKALQYMYDKFTNFSEITLLRTKPIDDIVSFQTPETYKYVENCIYNDGAMILSTTTE